MLPDAVSALFGGTATDVVRECRRCGTTVDATEESCPHCGPESDLVSYEIA